MADQNQKTPREELLSQLQKYFGEDYSMMDLDKILNKSDEPFPVNPIQESSPLVQPKTEPSGDSSTKFPPDSVAHSAKQSNSLLYSGFNQNQPPKVPPGSEILIVPGPWFVKEYYAALEDYLTRWEFTVSWFWLPSCTEDGTSYPVDDVLALQQHVTAMCNEGRIALVMTWDYGGFVTSALAQHHSWHHRNKKNQQGGILCILSLGGLLPNIGDTVWSLTDCSRLATQKSKKDNSQRLVPRDFGTFFNFFNFADGDENAKAPEPLESCWFGKGLLKDVLSRSIIEPAWYHIPIFYVHGDDVWISPQVQQNMADVPGDAGERKVWQNYRFFPTARVLFNKGRELAEFAIFAFGKSAPNGDAFLELLPPGYEEKAKWEYA